MKHIRRISTIILLLLLLITGAVQASAMQTGFSTESMPQEDIDSFLQNVNVTKLAKEPSKAAIKCFDVNERGEIAVGCGKGEIKTVCIYNSTGDYLYGYSFSCTGSFGVELNGNILNIYFVRSDVAVAVDPEGEVKSVLEIQDTTENNKYWNHTLHATTRKAGDAQYTIRNDMGFFNLFASSCSQLVVTDKDGNTTIIYDVNKEQLSNTVASFVVIVLFICCVIVIVVWEFVKLRRKIANN